MQNKFSYYYSDSNQILHNNKDLQVLIVGGPKMCPTNPAYRHLEKHDKLLYRSNRLTDFDEILHSRFKCVLWF